MICICLERQKTHTNGSSVFQFGDSKHSVLLFKNFQVKKTPRNSLKPERPAYVLVFSEYDWIVSNLQHFLLVEYLFQGQYLHFFSK